MDSEPDLVLSDQQVQEVTPTSNGVANPAESKLAAVKPSHLVEAGTTSQLEPLREESSDQKKTTKQATDGNRQVDFQMELTIEEDSEGEGWGDESRFSNSVEETDINNSGQWIKTPVVIPYPVAI